MGKRERGHELHGRYAVCKVHETPAMNRNKGIRFFVDTILRWDSRISFYLKRRKIIEQWNFESLLTQNFKLLLFPLIADIFLYIHDYISFIDLFDLSICFSLIAIIHREY